MSKAKFLSIFLLIVLGVCGRVFFVVVVKIPNFEIISALSLLAGFAFGGAFAFLLPLAIISLSDVFIGNTNILLFTWSAFGLIGLLGTRFGKQTKFPGLVFKSAGFGAMAACFFFIYTNFGWWVLGKMYPHTLQGLLQCYINGLPFFKTNLIGDIIFAPMVFSAYFAVKTLNYKIKTYDFIRHRYQRTHKVGQDQNNSTAQF